MGLHTGEALKEADDFFGSHVALAARIAATARGGEILVSSLLKELTESSGDLVFGPGRDVDLKGFSESRQGLPAALGGRARRVGRDRRGQPGRR